MKPNPPSTLEATHAEIATVLGITKQAVAAIERRALRKLKAECERLGLTLEDLLPIQPENDNDECKDHSSSD